MSSSFVSSSSSNSSISVSLWRSSSILSCRANWRSRSVPITCKHQVTKHRKRSFSQCACRTGPNILNEWFLCDFEVRILHYFTRRIMYFIWVSIFLNFLLWLCTFERKYLYFLLKLSKQACYFGLNASERNHRLFLFTSLHTAFPASQDTVQITRGRCSKTKQEGSRQRGRLRHLSVLYLDPASFTGTQTSLKEMAERIVLQRETFYSYTLSTFQSL